MASMFPFDISNLLAIQNVRIFYGVTCGAGSGYISTCSAADALQLDIPAPSPGTTADAVFTDTATPCFSGGGGDPINKEALDDLTCQFAFDFLTWLGTQFDYTFIGTVAVQPNGFIDEIEFDFTGNAGKSQGEAKTRIRSMPWNGWPNELGHDDPDCPGSLATGTLTLGIATTDIPSGSTTGKVQLYDPTGMTAVGNPVTVANNHGWWDTDIPSGSHVIVGNIGCVLRIVSANCSTS